MKSKKYPLCGRVGQMKIKFHCKGVDIFYFLGELAFHTHQGPLNIFPWCKWVGVIFILVGKMSLLGMLSVSISELETSVSNIILKMWSLPNESRPGFPILSSGEYTYLSFCVTRNCHLRAISVPTLAYFFCLCSFISHMGIFLSVWVNWLSMHKWQQSL